MGVLSFVDDLLVIQNTESDLQESIFKRHQICKQYNMNISTVKTKVLAFETKICRIILANMYNIYGINNYTS